MIRSAASGPDIAVVIATYRRPALLRRCLTALIAQQGVEDGGYEIIIVDDGCSDDTLAVVNEFAGRTAGSPAVRYLRPNGTRGPAAARRREPRRRPPSARSRRPPRGLG